MALIFRGCPGTDLPAVHRHPEQPIAFLDRDGVINVDHGYVFEQHKFEWMPGAREAVAQLKEQGVRVVVLTNQSGIGRGYYSEPEFLALTDWMVTQVSFDAVCYCPHAPEENCPARKPGTAMFEAVQTVLGFDRGRSVFLGDKDSDMEAAVAYGVHGIKFGAEGFQDLLARLGF